MSATIMIIEVFCWSRVALWWCWVYNDINTMTWRIRHVTLRYNDQEVMV